MSSYPGFPDRLAPKAAAFFEDALARVQNATDRHKLLAEIFPSLPRRLGKAPLGTGLHTVAGATIDLAAWRLCDAGAARLLEAAAAEDACLLDLYYHGDFEEKTMVFRSRATAPVSDATITLLGEAQRTNTGDHFEAAVCDSDLLVRAVENGALSLVDFNRILLKMAFVDLPFARVLRGATQANEELSRMAQDLATEREAAGRRIWRDTNTVIALAPTVGSLARLAGSLEHGDDNQRRTAALGLAHVSNPSLIAMARERLDREPVAAIRAALQAAIDSAGAH